MAEDKTLGTLAHILGYFTSFLAPLIIWLVGKDKGKFTADNSRHALNFQISLIIYSIIIGIVVSILGVITLGLGFILLPLLLGALLVFDLVVCIIATIKASNGEVYKYPLEIEFIK